MHFINRRTWKASHHYIIIIMIASFMRVSRKLVFHQSKCISAIKRIHSTTATYISLSSSMCLYIPWYWDACLKSSPLRVGVKTLHNTIHQWFPTFFDAFLPLLILELFVPPLVHNFFRSFPITRVCRNIWSADILFLTYLLPVTM